MTTIRTSTRKMPEVPAEPSSLPPLENGDQLDQRTFHERYEAMPEDTRAELIGGIVYLSARVKRTHGRAHGMIIAWLSEYADATPGTEALNSASAILGPESEPQPDACLLISPQKSGQPHEEDEYIVGAPELIVEVTSGKESIDLHRKRTDYEQAGVKEYVVVVIRQAYVLWLVARGGRFTELAPGPHGIFRSAVFPGLWLDPAALLRHDGTRVREVLQQGLASSEHAAFVARLAGQGP